MSFSMKSCDAPLGAEIAGVDLAAELDETSFEAIKRTLDERSVVVMRGQKIDPDHFVRFAERFGKLLVHPHNSKTGLADYPEIFVLSNIIENGRNIGQADGGMIWHTDGCYLSKPDMYTVLYALEVPAQNG